MSVFTVETFISHINNYTVSYIKYQTQELLLNCYWFYCEKSMSQSWIKTYERNNDSNNNNNNGNTSNIENIIICIINYVYIIIMF